MIDQHEGFTNWSADTHVVMLNSFLDYPAGAVVEVAGFIGGNVFERRIAITKSYKRIPMYTYSDDNTYSKSQVWRFLSDLERLAATGDENYGQENIRA